jgi:hypothetical protein
MSTTPTWHRLGDPVPTGLVEARLQLHWAAQLVAAVGTTLLVPAPDDSHTQLEWLAGPGMLAGRLTPAAPQCRAALRCVDLTLHVLDEQEATVAARHLDGLTLSQGLVWLEQEIAAYTRRPLPRPLRRRALELPDHPVAHGAAFSASAGAALAELGRWYANADAVLRVVAARAPHAAPVRCWPHHFDIATLLVVDPEASPETRRTIGVGLSPGDTAYLEPYWYVTPWPYPPAPQLPILAGGGVWHQAGWLGAVLTAQSLTQVPSAPAQAERVHAFLGSAIQACQALLATTDSACDAP